MEFPSLQTLRESVVNLSKSDTIHYEVTQQAYLLTVAQLMKAEGIETLTLEETAYVARFEQMQKLDNEITAKQKRLEKLLSDIYRAESEIKKIEENLPDAKKKVEKPKRKAKIIAS